MNLAAKAIEVYGRQNFPYSRPLNIIPNKNYTVWAYVKLCSNIKGCGPTCAPGTIVLKTLILFNPIKIAKIVPNRKAIFKNGHGELGTAMGNI